MKKVYTDKDADLGVLKNKTLAVIGFGSQGHAHALNLKDSGLKVIIGLYEGSKSIKVAKEKGFKVVTTAEAVKQADVIMLALPDTKQAAIYLKDIAPNLTKGKTLVFAHGFAIHFKTIVPPKNVNIILVAPKGPGHTVRSQYAEGKGVPDRHLSKPRQGCEKNRARLGQGHWRHPCRRARNLVQGRDGNRFVRRTDRPLRRRERADPCGL
jgi:ketol-acid reductoisomerase